MQLTNSQFRVFTDLSIWGDWVATPIEGLSFPSKSNTELEGPISADTSRQQLSLKRLMPFDDSEYGRPRQLTAYGVEPVTMQVRVLSYWANHRASEINNVINVLSRNMRLFAYCVFVYRAIPVTDSRLNQLLSEFSCKKSLFNRN